MAGDSRELRKALVVRFKKIRGQIQGIQRMLPDKSCKEVFIQLSAVKSALDKASLLVLENHMQHCLLGATDEPSIETQKASLITFIRNYKYGSNATPYIRQDLNVLLNESVRKIGIVIETVEDFDENRCTDVLSNTSEIRELLGRVGLILFEQEIETTLVDRASSEEFDALERILNMAKKFII